MAMTFTTLNLLAEVDLRRSCLLSAVVLVFHVSLLQLFITPFTEHPEMGIFNSIWSVHPVIHPLKLFATWHTSAFICSVFLLIHTQHSQNRDGKYWDMAGNIWTAHSWGFIFLHNLLKWCLKERHLSKTGVRWFIVVWQDESFPISCLSAHSAF